MPENAELDLLLEMTEFACCLRFLNSVVVAVRDGCTRKLLVVSAFSSVCLSESKYVRCSMAASWDLTDGLSEKSSPSRDCALCRIGDASQSATHPKVQ